MSDRAFALMLSYASKGYSCLHCRSTLVNDSINSLRWLFLGFLDFQNGILVHVKPGYPVSSLEQLTRLKVEAHSNLLHGDFQGTLQICHDVLQIIHRQPESTQHAEDQILFFLMRIEAELRLGLFQQAREGLESTSAASCSPFRRASF